VRDFGIPSLLPDQLATGLPTAVYAGGPVTDPTQTLFLWRTYSLTRARGMTVGFFVWDDKLEQLWRQPEKQTARLLAASVMAVIEPDFSLWADAPLAEQIWNVYRTRTLGRLWQERGLSVIPNLNWSGPESFNFCFQGIPFCAPVVACECRTAGQNERDRCAFLGGLWEGIHQREPAHVLIYGGVEHESWLAPQLPPGPRYTLLESWTRARGRLRRAAERQQRARNQLTLFPTTGEELWADEAQAAAAVVA